MSGTQEETQAPGADIEDPKTEGEAQLYSTEDGLLDVDIPLQPVRAYVRSSAPYIAGQGIGRYHDALRNLIPVRRKVNQKEGIGVDSAGIFSFIFCTWLSKLMYKAHRKSLAIDDMPQGSPLDSCDHNVQRLEMFWQEELTKHGPSGASFSHAVWRFTRTRLFTDWIIFTISALLGCLTPMVFMRKLLEFAEDPKASFQTGLMWALLLMFCELFRILFLSWRWIVAFRTAVRLRAACLGLMYRKIIRLNNFEEKYMGHLINLFASDSQRIFNMILFGPMVIGGPMILICVLWYISSILGSWALLGILIFVAFYPVQYGISRLCGSIRGKTVKVSDKRVSLISEILTCIKTIKMNAWEKSFEDQISSIRRKEQNFIEKSAFLSGLGVSLGPTVPIISAIISFLAHTLSGNSLTAAQVFPIQALFSAYSHSVMCAVQNGLTAMYEARIGLRRLQAFPFVTVMMTEGRRFFNVTHIGWMNTFEAHVGLKRIQRFLLIEEVQTRIQRPIDRAQAISIGGASFLRGCDWGFLSHSEFKVTKEKRHEELVKKSDIEAAIEEREKLNKVEKQVDGVQPVLKSINFSAPKGHLVGVCGPVGSGKSSLLLAILGQMRLVNGQLARDGSCAYVSQQAWLTNGTLRDNVLFGEAFVPRRYYSVINSCLLNEDLNHLPGGDLTEIGERGVNLSGGQRQRVALARALYSNRDIYLLDDPLSAVDVHIGASIFESYILKELQNKTVVFVSHQIMYLSRCDVVYVMKDGHVIERGTHEELLRSGKEYASMMTHIGSNSAVQSHSEMKSLESEKVENGSGMNLKETFTSGKNEIKENQAKDSGERLTVNEPSHVGSLKADTYLQYTSAAGGYFVAFLVFLVFLCNVGSTAFSSWWLATWIKAGAGDVLLEVNNTSNSSVPSTNLADNPDYEFYQTVYGSTIAVILITCGIRCFVFTKATLRASTTLHRELFQKLVYSKMLFFETNPIGRMQSLFSRDIDTVDSQLPSTVENTIQNLWIVAFTVLFICIVFPWFFVAFIPLSILYYFVSKIFRKGIRDLKRLENITQSPVFSCLAETLQGLTTIHAFGKEGDFMQRFFQLYDENGTCNFLWNVGMRWMAVRVDLLAAVTTSITACLVVALNGVVVPAMAGLALAYSWHVSGVLQYTTRLISETEIRFISVERILAYGEGAVAEGKGKCSKPPPSWPNRGYIRFQNVSLRYRKTLPNVLHSISFNILPGEKIGVVGRTGSGKSSLAVALFRLVELSSGTIKLDDLDISEVPLAILRAKISIIPQEPVLFSGTIRSNLDRENKFNDKELWDVLAKTKLLDRVSAMPLKLDTVISPGSVGLSVGESQLVCLARALLRNTKVLIMDEATASIDPETEAALQSTVQKEFVNSTVFIIAHRLSTITNCDRILVMDQGKVIEFNSPTELLANPKSAFSRMMAVEDTSVN